jgi:hypothetical protein
LFCTAQRRRRCRILAHHTILMSSRSGAIFFCLCFGAGVGMHAVSPTGSTQITVTNVSVVVEADVSPGGFAGDGFGAALGSWTDLDGDGAANETLVGMKNYEGMGAVACVALDGSVVLNHVIISSGKGGLPEGLPNAGDAFGSAISPFFSWASAPACAWVSAMPVAADGYIVMVCFNASGFAEGIVSKLTAGMFLPSSSSCAFGSAVSEVADLDGDGLAREMAIGCVSKGGSVFIASLTEDAGLLSFLTLSDGQGGIPSGALDQSLSFAASLSPFFFAEEGGVTTRGFAVGALWLEEPGAYLPGGVYFLTLEPAPSLTVSSIFFVGDGYGGMPWDVVGDNFGFCVSAFFSMATEDGRGPSGDGAWTVLVTGSNNVLLAVDRTAQHLLGYAVLDSLEAECFMDMQYGCSLVSAAYGGARILLGGAAGPSCGTPSLVLADIGCTWPTSFRNNSLACTACPAGTAYTVPNGTCEACPANTYSREANSPVCSPCPGHQRSAVQSTSCTMPPTRLSPGAIAGIALGGSAILLATLAYCVRRSRGIPSSEASSQGHSEPLLQ